MWTAPASRYLVPADGSFELDRSPTEPPKKVPGGDQARKRLQQCVEELDDLARCLYAARQDRSALHLPGDGRRRQGRHHPRGVQRGQSRRLSGLLVQAALAGGARPRLPVAHRARLPRARPHRRLQPQLLRRGAGGARAPRVPGVAAAARGAPQAPKLWDERWPSIREHEQHLAAQRHRGRSSSGSTSRSDEQRQRFLARLDEPEQELEVLRGRRARERALGRLHDGLPGGAERDLAGRGRRGTRSRPTTSPSPACASPRSSSTRCGP